MIRKGLGKGRGQGYYNLVPMDSYIHSLSAKGVKTLSPKMSKRLYGEKNLCPMCGTPRYYTKTYGWRCGCGHTDRYGLSAKGTVKVRLKSGKEVWADPDEIEAGEYWIFGYNSAKDTTGWYFSKNDIEKVLNAKGMKQAYLEPSDDNYDSDDTFIIRDKEGNELDKWFAQDLVNEYIKKNKIKYSDAEWEDGEYVLYDKDGEEIDRIYAEELVKTAYSEMPKETKERLGYRLDAKGFYPNLVTPKQPETVYHKGIYSPMFDEDKIPKAKREIVRLKNEIKNLLYDVKEYKGETAEDHELMEVTVLKDKLPHFNFLTSHTDIDATGYFKDNALKTRFDEENNAIIQVEYLDTKSENVGRDLVKKLKRLNELEIGESLLYVRTEQLEDTSLPLAEWRDD